MTKKLRSNFDPGTTRWAIRRAQWRALGLSDADMLKPKIAVVNSSSELSICFSHLDEVAALVKDGIREAGGIPFEVRTSAPSDFITGAGRGGRYLMPTRDLLVNDIEVAVEGAVLDGMVCLSSCDKTAPAHMMAAARLNLPSLLVIGGYQACGRLHDEPVDIEDVFESVGELATGGTSIRHIEELCEVAVKSPGVCAGMGTANTMHIMAEAVGMTLPGSAPVAAYGTRMREMAFAAGRRIVGMVAEDLRPRDILTPGAFANAIAVGLAVSGSINMLRHLQAVAEEGGVPVDVYRLIDQLGAVVPLLCAIKPNGPGRIEDLERAGGTLSVMKRLEPILQGDAITVSGRSVRDVLADVRIEADTVVGTMDRPAAPGPSVVILRGTLAPEGAIMKLGSGKKDVFQGPCRVFESQEDALAALGRGEITGGQVIVLRGLGARGGPGVASASWFVAAVNGAHLGEDIAVITDGQLSGLNRGMTVGQVMPEAADGGPIGVVSDGDEVIIDIQARRIDLLVDAVEVERRLSALPSFRSTEKAGWLALYQDLVQPLTKGGVLRPKS
ncbi:Dihydroxy-acid dehydratase [Ancylobacter novellus DSM 506]|uniref:Dihydroxy-acid dehydratase n=1 Tax=Ancylobacter novellus (strain ATCC 8093 / DSM 506 / JCM 20403 / CCM 1077 / IAM 12100 / NBRC 12443 / NCIMB 10456) TaxID=639283 RepID=D7A2Q4_ANCN5|nr:dihydroxy-acid dehydratase [Ancylobacter novellus]ADH91584.1 Dihydroxy-acid dehydratase [Ancylobacter novellus DSM 506]